MAAEGEGAKIMDAVTLQKVRLEQIEFGLESIQRRLKKLTEVLYEEMKE